MIEKTLHVKGATSGKESFKFQPSAIIIAQEIDHISDCDGNQFTGNRCEEDAALLAEFLRKNLPAGTYNALVDRVNQFEEKRDTFSDVVNNVFNRWKK